MDRAVESGRAERCEDMKQAATDTLDPGTDELAQDIIKQTGADWTIAAMAKLQGCFASGQYKLDNPISLQGVERIDCCGLQLLLVLRRASGPGCFTAVSPAVSDALRLTGLSGALGPLPEGKA